MMLPGEAAAIARDVAAGSRSAVSVVTGALAAIDEAQGPLNAFTSVDAESSLARAESIDEAVARGEEVGTLVGVPLAIKDLIDQEGIPNTRGSSFPPLMPAASATVVRRLEAEGAVIVGRTGLHEFAYGFSSENPWFGPVRNPWNRSTSPGGSSGGSAVAVAASTVAVAIGTDTGGSVRVPAALCGIYGLKVTHGRVPLTGVYPLAPWLDTVGPLARSIGDLVLTYQALAGYDAADPWSAERPVEKPQSLRDITRLTLGIPHPWVDRPMTTRVAEGFEEFLRRVADAGVSVAHLEAPELVPGAEINTGAGFEIAAVHRETWTKQPDRYGSEVAGRLAEAMAVTEDDYRTALQWRRERREAAAAALARCDALATPTVGGLDKTIGVDTMSVAGRDIHYRTVLAQFTSLVNHLGLPALALPVSDAAGPPLSVQLIGPAWGEASLLEIGMELEREAIARFEPPPHWYGERL